MEKTLFCETCGKDRPENQMLPMNSWGDRKLWECLKCRGFRKKVIKSQTHPSTNLTKRILVCEDCPYKYHPCPEGCSKKV